MAKAASPPKSKSLRVLKDSAQTCLVCAFAVKSTQTVFGEGPKRARLMLVGEQPGNAEDLAGHPFVGPAGALLEKIFTELGIRRDDVYVTNAVKHFKYVRKGKIRLHAKPNSVEIANCRPWLASEVAAVQPQVIVALGATAADSVCGRSVAIGRHRGQWLTTPLGPARVLVSWHPSAILRAPDERARAEKREQLKMDLAQARDALT